MFLNICLLSLCLQMTATKMEQHATMVFVWILYVIVTTVLAAVIAILEVCIYVYFLLHEPRFFSFLYVYAVED